MSSGDEFVSEPITPEAASFDTSAMSRGEPGIPRRFTWRAQTYEVAALLSTWKTSTRERGELYLRRHWFEIQTKDDRRMTLYCERQKKMAKKPKQRWWVYSVSRASM
ncbi:MAG TPA: DUF6504 family protein [Tepidisphaeraceae bacterium]|nr:DUF6504 family protein [Tepidisphaeraceae bacterium]